MQQATRRAGATSFGWGVRAVGPPVVPEPYILRYRGRSVPIHETQARTILSPTSGFLARAGFTHSLTPARNCLLGCTYCYVPTMRFFGGLKPEDWQRWGRHTTRKTNAAALLRRSLRPRQVIYCSPLVDPYQPSEARLPLMPGVLAAMADSPPRVLVLQTRSTLVLRDLDLLAKLSGRTRLRVSFSLTTDRDDVRRLYEPHCESIERRVEAVCELDRAGIAVHCTLAPILPCSPEILADLALESTCRAVIADPLHSREAKPRGATTRRAALKISRRHGWECWHDPSFQASITARLRARVVDRARQFGVGEKGFRLLSA